MSGVSLGIPGVSGTSKGLYDSLARVKSMMSLKNVSSAKMQICKKKLVKLPQSLLKSQFVSSTTYILIKAKNIQLKNTKMLVYQGVE